MKKIICIGSTTKDIFVSLSETNLIENKKDITAKKLLTLEFGAKIYADTLKETLGGSASNIATGLTLCNTKAFVLSRVSKSPTGKWILKQLGKHKIKKNYVQQTGKEESEVSVIIFDKKNKDHIILRTGDSINLFDLKKSLDRFREKAHWIYVGSQKKNWLKNMEHILNFANQKNAKISLNPSSFQISQDAKSLVRFFDKISILFLNRDEAIELVKNTNGKVEDNPLSLLKEIKKWKAETIVITDGKNGAYATHKKDFFHLPILKGKIIDTVGAGDAFTAAFLASFSQDSDLKKALSWGITNSAGVLGKWGTTNGLLTKKELIHQSSRILKKIKKLR